MGKNICLNVTSDGNKYSSPIPAIGLYIAAGTLVCVLLMVCDIIHGLRSRKPWIPCRFFSLNSLTLTLLAIASKLPVDLTTSMPSSQDQISKLGSTVLICICMNFFSVSLATQSDSERLSNMISLTILVITVVVNVSIQMVTGVIFSFFVEHVIIMSCMLLLLSMIWITSEFYTRAPRFAYSSTISKLKNSDPQNSESKSMIHRLNSVYVSIHEHNPEFEILDSPVWFSTCLPSLLCALVLLQAAFKSLVLKKVTFRCGLSDYKWSVWMVVGTQILIVLVGVIATILRWFLSIKMFTNELTKEPYICFGPHSWFLSTLSKLRIISFFKICKRGLMFIFQSIKRYVTMVLMVVTTVLWMLSLILSLVFYVLKRCFDHLIKQEDMSRMEKRAWIQRSCEEDIKKWMEKGKRDSPTHLVELLSKRTPSQQPLTNGAIPTSSNENKVSCLLVVIFIRVAIVALPDKRVASLIHTLDEAFEIIYFIEKKINENTRSCAVAKDLWMNRKNNFHWFHRRFVKPSVKKFYGHEFKKSMDGSVQSQSQLDLCCALGIIEELKETNDKIVWYPFEEGQLLSNEIETIHEFIMGEEWRRRAYTSIDELHDHVEKLFVDMLYFFLSQLPLAIFKHLVESPIKEYEERARFAIKLLCKLEQLEDKVQWTFPDGTGITSLTTPQIHHSLPDSTRTASLIIVQDSSDSEVAARIEPVESNLGAEVAYRVIEDVETQERV